MDFSPRVFIGCKRGLKSTLRPQAEAYATLPQCELNLRGEVIHRFGVALRGRQGGEGLRGFGISGARGDGAMGLTQDRSAFEQPRFFAQRLCGDQVNARQGGVPMFELRFEFDGFELQRHQRTELRDACVKPAQSGEALARVRQSFGAFEVMVGLGARQPGDGAGVITRGGAVLFELNISPCAQNEGFGVRGVVSQKAREGGDGQLRLFSVEPQASATEFDFAQRGIQFGDLVEIGARGLPITMQPMQFAAHKIKLGVARFTLDLPGHGDELFVYAFVRSGGHAQRQPQYQEPAQ